MTCNLMHAVQQRAEQRTHLIRRESVISGYWVTPMAPTPFPVWRQHCRQPRHVGTGMAQPGRVGVSEPLGDTQADIARAPFILEADVQQMAAQRQLGDDPGIIENIFLARKNSGLPGKKLLTMAKPWLMVCA